MEANFDLARSKIYTQTELDRMMPFEWEMAIIMVKKILKKKNELSKK